MSFQSLASPEFWKCYESLPAHVRVLADAKFALFESDPFHPSLALKQKGEVWTADIGRSYRAIAYREGNDFHWFWIGTHEAYNKLLARLNRERNLLPQDDRAFSAHVKPLDLPHRQFPLTPHIIPYSLEVSLG